MLPDVQRAGLNRFEGDVMDEWPANWREILDKYPQCHRCGSIAMGRLYCLSNEYPNIEVCSICADAYYDHIKKFVNQIQDLQQKRKEISEGSILKK